MAKKEVEQVEDEVVEQTPPPEATPRTFSQEEVDTLVATREELAAEIARKAEFDRLNPIMSQQGADLKRLQREQSQPSKRSSVDKIHLAEMEAREKDTGETNPRIAQLKAEIAEEEKREVDAQQTRIRETQETISGYQKRVEVLGLTEDSEDYLDIKDWVESGKYPRAEVRLKKLEKGKPVEKPKETEDERVNRLVEEKLRAEMEKKGMLSSDTGSPSGSGGKPTFTEAQIADREFYEANREEILKAYKEGRIIK